jgi:membrane-associated phospholipid phosphatase
VRAVVLVLCLLATTAHADDEPWYRGRHGTNRIVHLTIAAGGTILYPAFGPRELAPDACRWCEPNALDRSVRDALRWDNVGAAGRLSDAGGYLVTPGLAIGALLIGTAGDLSVARSVDDLVPILETQMIARWATRGAKLAFGRQRPYAHYTGAEDEDDNLSFPSGHTSFVFSIAVSAGTVAHLRGYRSEPLVWIVGLTLASATGYLRIAADRHYLTDVIGGAVVGTAAGLTVPLLMRRNVELLPSNRGIAIAGVW